MIEDITWCCPGCRVRSEHRILEQHVTQGSPGWYIDTVVECEVCETVEEVTDHTRRDPREEYRDTPRTE